jgi:hypothetical protein
MRIHWSQTNQAEAIRAKISNARKGKPGNKLGWVTPLETRIKLSKALKGKKQSEEHRLKNSICHKGINKILISSDDLQLQYYKQGKSTVDIAKEYNCSYTTISKLLREYNIPIRSLKESQNLPLCLAKTAPSRARGKPSTNKGKKRPQISLALRKYWETPRDNHRLAMMQGMHIRPNRPETKVLQTLDTFFPNQWKYTGDGSFILAGLNPDFLNINGIKVLIEVFGDYWHKDDNPQDRINKFLEYGFHTLILWEKDINNSKVEELASTINTYLHNVQHASHKLPEKEG